MQLFEVIGKIYTSRDFNWLSELDDNEDDIPNLTLFNYLISDEETSVRIRHLSSYIFYLPSKMFIVLLHLAVPKRDILPRLSGVKRVEEDSSSLGKLLLKIRKYFKYSEKEFEYIRPFILKFIRSSREDWFEKFGVIKDDKGMKEEAI